MTVIVDITQLNGGSNGSVKGSDVYPAVDITDTTQATTGTTKRYQIVQLIDFFLDAIGITNYDPCVAASVSTLNATYNNGISGVGATLTNAGVKTAFMLDSQTGVVNYRYLIKDMTSPAYNGIYTLTTVGDGSTNWVLTRATDFNSSSNITNNGTVFVTLGTVNANTLWKVNFTGSVVVGTTLLNWSTFSFTPDIIFTWNVVTGTTQQIVNENGYVPRNAGLTTFTLPLTANIGEEFQIRGYPSSGGWKIAQNVGQQLYVGMSGSTAGILGYVASNLATNSAVATCIDDSTGIWSILPQGNLTVA